VVETGEEGRLYSMGRILTLEIVHFSVFLSDKGSYIVTETCPPCLPAKFHSAFIVFFTNAKMFSSLLVGWLVGWLWMNVHEILGFIGTIEWIF